MKKQANLFLIIFLGALFVVLANVAFLNTVYAAPIITARTFRVSDTVSYTVSCTTEERPWGGTITECIAQARNGPNNADSGGCGIACVPLCDNAEFNQGGNINECKTVAGNTAAWSKYNAVSREYSHRRWNIRFAHYRTDDLCSIADKCHGNRCADGGGSPYLRPGQCECESVGPTPYKICCMNGIPVNAIWAPGRLQDGYSPEEGMCPGGFEPPVGVLTCAGSAPVIPIPNGTLPPDTNGTPNGNGNGTPNGNGNIPSGTCVGGIHLPGSVTADVWASPDCLPSQPRNGRQTTISWRGTAPNICDSIIGGGSPSDSTVTCRNNISNNDDWAPGQSGAPEISALVTVSPIHTRAYSIRCNRPAYTCSNAAVTFSSGDACDRNCNTLTLNSAYSNNIASCACNRYCAEYWTSWDPTNPDRYCARWRQCWLDPLGNACAPGTPNCTRQNCEPLACERYHCRTHRYRQTVTSRTICASSATDSQVVRVIQKPTITIFETNPQRTQILLNQFINLRWNAVAPDSGAPGIQVNTTLRCTPSIGSGGDAEGWGGTLNSLDSSGTVSNLSPARTTRYQLVCRNSDDIAPNQCFYDSDLRARDIKVFTPDLREVPASPR